VKSHRKGVKEKRDFSFYNRSCRSTR